MKFIHPAPEELSYLRPDPLLWEQELDVRPDVAENLEKAVGLRAGRVYWRSDHDHLYALELADLGRERPSMVMVYGHWDRYEPRPPEHEIDADLFALLVWVADVVESLDPADFQRVSLRAGIQSGWPEGSVLQTPEERFARLPGFAHEPRYANVEGLRMAYVEAGCGDPILMLHGEPTWGYLYRHMIPPLAEAGHVIVPDLIGFGRSDKPKAPNAYSYKAHVRWLRKLIQSLDLRNVTLVCQDWGGALGLRVLAQMPERFKRLVAMNTGIPTGGGGPNDTFLKWRRFSQRVEALDLPALVRGALKRRELSDAEAAAYAAPFPAKEYQTGALVFPRLVPIRPDHPGAYDNRLAVEVLKTLDLPVLLPWGADDPITAAGQAHLRSIFRNAAPPLSIAKAGHFIQEDAGEEVARHIVDWMKRG
jgi:haloalkane dehalogenase